MSKIIIFNTDPCNYALLKEEKKTKSS